MTIHEALERASGRLASAEVPDAAWDAELLLLHVLGWDRARLLARLGESLPQPAEQRYAEMTAARASRRPLQHLTETQAFWRREFLVSPDVLIPRPETEVLVEAALARLAGMAAPLVIDVGTGSGCIAISIACDRPEARVYATDISPRALAVARRNAERLGCAERLSLLAGDLLAPLQSLTGTVDVVVSNPPYVDRADAATLAPEVREHEPEQALFASGDALSVYRRLAPEAWSLLRPAGWLLLEIGMGMAAAVDRLLRDAGFVSREVLPDLNGIPRVVVARKTEM